MTKVQLVKRAMPSIYEAFNQVLGILIKSGQSVLCDPCYKDEKRIPTKNGTWAITVTAGKRTFEGRYLPKDEFKNPRVVRTEYLECGVDSGMLGFFDGALDVGYGEYGELDTFYGECCDATEHERLGVRQLTGAVTTTRCGDGTYNAILSFDEDNELVKFVIDMNTATGVNV